MPTQTAAGILERLQTVLETQPLGLVASTNPFGIETEPNVEVGTTYRLLHSGLVHGRQTSNHEVVKLDRITVTVQQPLNFDGYAAQIALQDLLDQIARAVIADGPDHSYDATEERGSRRVTRPKNSDLAEASINFLIDYDWSDTES